MLRAVVLLVLIMALRVAAQPTVIQGPKCTGIIHGVVYEVSGQRSIGVRVIAFPVGVDLGALLPTTRADHNGEEAGYPSTFPDQNEFLYGMRTKTGRLNLLHRRAEIPVLLPLKPGRVLLHVRHSQTNSEIRKFNLRLKVPGQRRSPEETIEFDNNDAEVPVPSGRDVVLLVKVEGYKELSRSISVASGTRAILDLSVEPIK